MMAALAAGKRLKSAVCATEIMVIAAPDGDVELECGGAPMTDGEGNTGGSVDANNAEGTALGKRYVSEDGVLSCCASNLAMVLCRQAEKR